MGYVICSVSVCLCVVFKTGGRTGGQVEEDEEEDDGILHNNSCTLKAELCTGISNNTRRSTKHTRRQYRRQKGQQAQQQSRVEQETHGRRARIIQQPHNMSPTFDVVHYESECQCISFHTHISHSHTYNTPTQLERARALASHTRKYFVARHKSKAQYYSVCIYIVHK